MSDSPESILTAGQLLRQAREQRQLSLEQVALQLNLRVIVLQQIEQDQLNAETLPTFSRGYVKAYARFLKLPEREVMLAFEQTNPLPAVKVKPMRTFSNRTGKAVTENRFMWLTYIIIALLILSLLVWGWQSWQQDTVQVQENTLTEPLASAISVETVPLSTAATDDIELEGLQPVINPESNLLSTLDASTEWAETEQFSSQDQLAVDRLLMRFRDNCWIDVVDATGNRVAYGTKQAGYVMELTGQAPFLITLGNPSVVSIELNRKPYDMSALPGGRVARFSLPGQD